MRRALRLRLPFQASRVGPDQLSPMAREWFGAGGTVLAVRVRLGLSANASSGGGRSVTEDGALVGPPSFLADQVNAFRQLGVTDLSVMPGQDLDSSLRTIEALVEHVLPSLDA